ncbi:MAG TPA: flagellar type III secretion system pore protein FliP [Pirellulaceae bacterium]|nr:flagellar type III secretion system pore protein FliP [Pirellulaceae bacterium]
MRKPRTNKPPMFATRSALRWWLMIVVALLSTSGLLATAWAQTPALPLADVLANEAIDVDEELPDATKEFTKFVAGGPDAWTSREGLKSSLQIMLLLTVLSLAPALLLMTTCFVRIIVVMGLLRQALGTQQLPPSQVVTSIALFMTLLVMTPVWKQVYDDAIRPYTDPNSQMSLEQAWDAGVKPIRNFMSKQIDIAGNSDDVWLFYEYLPPETATPQSYDDVPLVVLLPAFMLSELKTAFLIGFQIYLPFLVLDIVIASVTISMGMMMLPPVMISLPFKLILFVLVDGWRLVVGMLLESFAPYG